MQQNLTLKARGLFTFPNFLGEVPDGSLQEASNVVIDRDGTISQRRGMKLYGTSLGSSNDTAKQLLLYQGRIIRHYSTTMDVDSDGLGTFEQLFDTSDNPVNVNESAPGLRIKYQEANGNLYFTSDTGIRKLSCTSNTDIEAQPVTNAGGIKALDGSAVLNPTEGWFTEDSVVAYRVVWGVQDNNSNVILGDPSERIIISNSQLSLMINDYNTLVTDLATVASTPVQHITGTPTISNPGVITGLSSTANLSIGMTVAGTDIPTGALISSITATTITINKAITSSPGPTSISFGQLLHDTDYASLVISSNSSAQVLWNALQFLAYGNTNKLDTDIGLQSKQITPITIVPTSVSFTGITNGTTSITGITPNTTGLSPGMPITSATGDILPGTIIDAVNSSSVITISQPATDSASGVGLTAFNPTFTSSGISDYFDIWSALNSSYYRVWFQYGTSLAPAQPLNSVLVQVSVGLTDTATIIATNLARALNNIINAITNVADFVAVPSGGTVTITNAAYGLANQALAYSALPSFTIGAVTLGVTPIFGSIALTPTTSPSNPATTGQLIQLQTYFDSIINALNSTTGISTYALSGIGGAFSNSTQSATVDLTFTIPASVTTADFYQIYRSAIFSSSSGSTLSDITPDDELQLIFEGNPTTGQIAALSITFTDNVPDSFRAAGLYLYTNANSGEGIDQSNDIPPLAQDITLFLNNTFYANTQLKYNVQIGLLSGVNLAGRSIVIAQNTTTNTYNFVIPQIVEVDTMEGDLFNNVHATTADYFDIFNANNVTTYRVFFQTPNVNPPSSSGVTLVECDIDVTDTAAQVAVKLINSVNEITNSFVCSQNNNQVTFTNATFGASSAPINHVNNSAFTIEVLTVGVGSGATTNPIVVSTAPTPAQVIDATARALVTAINKNLSEVVYAYYVSGTSDLPGLIELELRNYSASNFYVAGNDATVSALFNPPLTTTASISSISAANPTVITSAAHGLANGAQVLIYGSNSTPSINGVYTISGATTNTFTIPVLVTVSGNAGTYIALSTAIQGSNDAHPNRLYFSKNSEPEAVPLVNYIDIGPKYSAIVRILPLRSSLMVLTQAGLYQLSGTDPTNFQVQLFDSSTKISAPDSAVVLNNQIFMLSNQGVVCVSETGVSVLSRPIEDQIIPLLTPQYTNFNTATFAVGYEADRAYLLATVTETNDTVATQIFRWNTFTTTWTKFDMSKTCGVVNTSQNILYLGAADTNFIEVERKTFTRTDQADREQILTLPVNGVINNFITFGSLQNTDVGDVFVQTQYLTIAQFNRLLQYLDTDAGLNYKSYYATYQASPGFDLRSSLTLLATQLDADSGIVTHDYVSSISGIGTSLLNQQQAFNVITSLLNTDAGTRNKGYPTLTANSPFETIVTATNSTTAVITLQWAMPFVAGDIIQYKAINSNVEWAPHHFGDASMTKQVSESTILFNTFDFTLATASYSSDLAPGFVPITINGPGPGLFGGFTFGDGDNFGGDASSYPFRTLIPAGKQRCRYINGMFEHDVAREAYEIYGISYTFTPTSMRGYR